MGHLHPYRRVLGYFGRYRLALLLGVASVLLSRALMVAAPRFLGEAVNGLAEGAADEAFSGGAWFFAATVLAGLLTWSMRLLLVGTSRRVERDLKRDLFAHVLRLPAPVLDGMRTGDLMSRLTSDVEAVRFSLGPGLMYAGGTLVLFPLALASMLLLSPVLAVAALLPLLLIAGVVRWLGPAIMHRTRAVQNRLGDLSARAQESFSGARVVRAYATEPIEEEAFRRENLALVAETLGLARVRALMGAGLFALGGVAEFTVVWIGGGQVIAGGLGYGDLLTFLAYVSLLTWPMISVGWVVSAFQRSAAAMQRIEEIFQTPPEVDVHPPESRRPIAAPLSFQISSLTYAYPGSRRPALRDISLRVDQGETLGLVGPVGSGKSTLLRLLTRRYEPPPGTIHLGGADIRHLRLADLRALMAVVLQDPFLFSATIRENLADAVDGELNDDPLQAVLDAAGMQRDVAIFPKGVETRVGERGVMLSGGQKQRLTLARALLRDRPVLLLDDCLSAVDTETEAHVLQALQSRLRGRTVFIAAHRLSTVRHADRILVLEGGRLLQLGTHAELVQRPGWYARTWERQRLEAALEKDS